MKHILATLLFILLAMPLMASTIWQPVPEQASADNTRPATNTAQQLPGSRLMAADMALLDEMLQQAPPFTDAGGGVVINVPLPDGTMVELAVYNDPILAPEIAHKYPHIRTYKAIGTQNPAIHGRLEWIPGGFHAMLQTQGGIVMINPENRYNPQAPDAHHRSIAPGETGQRPPFQCSVTDHHDKTALSNSPETGARPQTAARTFGTEIKKYRLAVAATKEYSDAVASGNVLDTYDEIAVAVDRINMIYSRDLSLRLELASDEALISTNSADFTNNDVNVLLDEVEPWIDSKMTDADYDIGHLFSTGGGGVARVGVACDNRYKADGVTGHPNGPTGPASVLTSDVFYIEYVAHEIGHQLGAFHTFNASGSASGSGACDGARASDSAYEPGSGSTIMSYAGLCAEQDLQDNSDYYFHAASIEEVRTLVDSRTCGSTAPGDDSLPTANAGNDYTIPANTPFMLTASANSTTTPTYTWEQYDLGIATDSVEAMHTDQGSGPLIRSRKPDTNPVRYIPALSAILSGNLEAETGERLPTTDRKLNFKLTVRDGTSSIDQDDMQITVENNAGPLVISNSSADFSSLAGYDIINLQWQVANTDKPPVSCPAVDIMLSEDGGQTFDIPLAEGIANTGQTHIALPDTTTSNGRIRLQCNDNIFFTVNSANFAISAGPTYPDGTVSLKPVTAAVAEGNSGTTSMVFRIERSNDTIQETYSYQITPSGANPVDATDFLSGTLPPNGDITLGIGETQKDITLEIAGDTQAESNETFIISITNAGATNTILVNELTGMIVDDDTIYLNTPSRSSGGGGSTSWLLLSLMSLLLTTRLKTKRGQS